MCQKPLKIYQSKFKICQIPKEYFQKGKSFVTSCQSGEILQNLVTLVTTYLHRMFRMDQGPVHQYLNRPSIPYPPFLMRLSALNIFS